MSLLGEIARLANAWRAAAGLVSLHLHQHRHGGRLVQQVVRIHPHTHAASALEILRRPRPLDDDPETAPPAALADLLACAPTPLLLTADTTLAAAALPRRGEIAFEIAPGVPALRQDALPDGLWTLLPPHASAHLRLAHASDALATDRLPPSLRIRLQAARDGRPAGRLLVRSGRAVALLRLPPRPLLLRVR